MAGLYAGLEVTLEQTSVCAVDEEGRMVREAKVASGPDAITRDLRSAPGDYVGVGLDAGPLSQWLCFELKDADGLHRGAPCKRRDGW